MWIDFLKITGDFCLLYFALIMLYVGPRLSFHYVWMAAGIFLCGAAWTVELGIWFLIPTVIQFISIGLVVVGLLLLIAMEIRVFSKMWVVPHEEVQYVIILGACVRGTRVTRSLSYRLKKAASYAKSHPQCFLVVSGGQGPGEDITEAQAMSLYLQKLGISKERILLEDQSVNTRQNLVFSRRVILCHEEKKKMSDGLDDEAANVQEEKLAVAVCSNNFHMYRAMALAAAAGKWRVHGIAAMTDPFMWLSFTIREGIAVWKELAFGHIPWRQDGIPH